MYLQEYVRYKAKQKLMRDSLSYLDISTVGSQILHGKIFENFISDFAVNTFEFASVTEIKSMFEFAGTLIKDTLLKKQMTKRYEEKARLFPGKKAPVFSLSDISGKKISLTKYRGKIIYLDFWASWCGPCRMEMPASKILQKQFVGKDVVFLYISLDDDKNSWLKALKAEELNGVHLHAPGWENSVAKKYGINGIPAYFLIGRNGEILENNASRPSDKSTVDLINKALLK